MQLNPIAAALLNFLLTSCVLAQGYPKIPKQQFAEAQAKLEAADKLSDERFAAAMPIIQQWAERGKPYLPAAEKPSDLPQAAIPAFPGAEGGGKFSFGGRGGRVLVVTNLQDDGPGSFRFACEQAGPRIVVFNVAGIIQLQSRVRVRAPYITIAGNTAPGDGVCIAGNTVELETHDIVIRHMRFRRGALDAADRNDSIGGNPIGNIMIDHVSASWGLDENMSMYRHMYRPPGGGPDLKLPTVNITIQNSIFSEALNTYHHAFGSTIGGLNSTFHHNLWPVIRAEIQVLECMVTLRLPTMCFSTIDIGPSTVVTIAVSSTSSITISNLGLVHPKVRSPIAFSSPSQNGVKPWSITLAKLMWQVT